MSGWLPAEPEPDKDVVDWDMYLGPAAWRPFNAKLLDGFNFEKGGGFVGAFVGGGVLEWGSHCVDLCQWAVGDCPPPVEYNPPKDGQLVCPLRERRRADLPREGLDSARLLPRAVRRRDRLGRSGRQRQDGAQLAGAARRPHGRRNRRLPGDVPRPRLPRLREDAQPAEGERRRGLQRPHRLPRGEHRALPEPPGEVRPGQDTSSSTTSRPIACAPKPCANRGGCKVAPAAPSANGSRISQPRRHSPINQD